jgi:hypothetical protein
MGTLFAVIVLAFVVLVLAIIGFGLYELTPFARHSDTFRDPRTGRRRWDAPHLD